MQPGQVLGDREIEALHNGMINAWRAAGVTEEKFRDQQVRGAFIAGFARAVEHAVIARIAPEMIGGLN